MSEPAAPIGIRPLRAADLDRVVELERDLFEAGAWTRAMVVEELAAPGRRYVGAYDVDAPETLLGYAGVWFDGEVAQVMTIGVDRSRRRAGVGSALLTDLVAWARSCAADALLLEVRVDNEPALALYRRFGFELLGVRRRYYQPEDVDAFTLRLELPGVVG